MPKIYDIVLGREIYVQEEITPDIAEEHPHDMVLDELQVDEEDIEDE